MATANERLAERTRRLLRELGVRPRRERGQNFLIDPAVARRTAEIVCDGVRPRVLELGAGLGALTEQLAERSQAVIALELQPQFAAALQALFAGRPDVKTVEADALKVGFADLLDGPPNEWRVAGNLPYYAASAILLRLLETRPPFERLVAMVQREVGERLLARPGDAQYGSLSVLAAYRLGSARVALRVPRGAFYPQPKVDSVLLVLEPRQGPASGVVDEALLFAVIRAGFGQRRKQLVGTLTKATGLGPLDRGTAIAALGEAGFGRRARPEELDLGAFVALSNGLARSGVSVIVPP